MGFIAWVCFWNSEANDWGDNPSVTIRDHYLRVLIKNLILQQVKNKKNVIDIGCGTGFSTLYYAETVKKIVGIDYVDGMIEKARKFLNNPSYFKKVMSEFAVTLGLSPQSFASLIQKHTQAMNPKEDVRISRNTERTLARSRL